MILPEHKPSLLRQKTPPEREAYFMSTILLRQTIIYFNNFFKFFGNNIFN